MVAVEPVVVVKVFADDSLTAVEILGWVVIVVVGSVVVVNWVMAVTTVVVYMVVSVVVFLVRVVMGMFGKMFEMAIEGVFVVCFFEVISVDGSPDGAEVEFKVADSLVISSNPYPMSSTI